MIKAVVFDCFGVVRPDRLLSTYEHFGGDILADKEFIEDTVKAASHGMIEDIRQPFADRLGITPDEWMDVIERAENDLRVLNKAAALRKVYRVGLLTNASRGRMVQVIGQQELARCFDAVAESGSLGIAKPEPEAFNLMATMLGVEPNECVMVDDRDDYGAGALAVGMRFIRYESFDSFERQLEAILQK